MEDIEVEKTIKAVMSNAELLKGKEYIDFLLDFLQGKKETHPAAQKKYCYHELTEEEAGKLKSNLTDKDMVHYFNIKDGFKTLVDSLEFNTRALFIIQSLLEKDIKL